MGEHLRAGCKALPEPQLLDMFNNVYAEQTDELIAERSEMADYLASFEGAH